MIEALLGAVIGGGAALLGTWLTLRHESQKAHEGRIHSARRAFYDTLIPDITVAAAAAEGGARDGVRERTRLLSRLALYASPQTYTAAEQYILGMAEAHAANDVDAVNRLHGALINAMRLDVGLKPTFTEE